MIFNTLPNAPTGLDDNKLIPIADDVHYTELMINRGTDQFLEYQTGDFALCFYDADGITPITPTNGNITVEMAPMENVWMLPGIGNGVIDATTVIPENLGVATYSTPIFAAAAIQGRIKLTGITGATYVKAQFRRFK